MIINGKKLKKVPETGQIMMRRCKDSEFWRKYEVGGRRYEVRGTRYEERICESVAELSRYIEYSI